MHINNPCSARGWTALSLSEYGEVVLCYAEDDIFVTAKARTLQCSVGMEKIEEIYLKRLREEVVIVNTFAKTREVNNNLWSLKVYDICSKVARYVLHACSLIDGYYCVIEATLISADDYFAFMEQFDEFCSSIEFTELRREVGSLMCDGKNITVTGLSDVVLRRQSDTAMLFVSKNKYFAVSVVDSTQRVMLQKAVLDADLELIRANTIGDATIERFRVCNNTGIIELYSRPMNDKFIEVFGYWSDNTTTDIVDNLSLQFE